MNKSYNKILDMAKGFLITNDDNNAMTNAMSTIDAAKKEMADAKSKFNNNSSNSTRDFDGLLGMATSLLGKDASDEDTGFLNIAQSALGSLGDSIDPISALKDGKIDISDLLTLGKIFSKINK